MAEVWRDNFGKKVRENSPQEGSNNAIEFAKSYPSLTYDELAKCFDPNLAPIQFIWTLREQAVQNGEIKWFAKDSLVRNIRELCQEGWLLGEDGEFNAIHARSSWISELSPLGPNVEKQAELVRDRLKVIAPKGWMPVDINDPIVKQVFEGISFVQQAVQML
jgi:hypothetical protein